METFKTYIEDINSCLQEIINIFSLQEVTLRFKLLDEKNAIDNYDLDDTITPIPDVIVYKNQSIGDLPVPDTRKYYDFKGWFLEFEKDDYYTPAVVYWSNEVQDFSKVVAPGNTIVLYAKWELKTVAIPIDPCGGSVFPTTINIKYFENIEKELSKVQISKRNSVFTGWMANTNEIIDATTRLTTDITSLYAQYEAKYCTISFDYTYGNVIGNISSEADSILCADVPIISTLEVGDSFNLAADINGLNFIEDTALTATGYTFGGWSLLKNNPNVSYIVYVTGDMTLYAYWKPITYNINYQYRGIRGDTPIYTQRLRYGEAAALLPYETIFNENPRSDFEWGKSGRFTHPSIYLYDNELVENLTIFDDENLLLYNNVAINQIPAVNNGKIYKVENNRVYSVGEKFRGIDFNIYFTNGKVYHPSKITPIEYNVGVNEVVCIYDEAKQISATCTVRGNSTEHKLIDVEFDIESWELKTNYSYGTTFDFSRVYVTEKFLDGSEVRVNFNEYPTHFITYPDKQSVLKSSGTAYFGYISISDGTVWPHVDGNPLLWEYLTVSAGYTVSSGEKAIVITNDVDNLKYNYIEGEKLDISGLKLMLEMTTHERYAIDDPISMCNFEPSLNDRLTLADTTVRISLKGKPNVSATYDISITEKQVVGFEIIKPNGFTGIVNSDTTDVSTLNMYGFSCTINYDSNTSNTRSYSNISNQIELDCKNLSSRYGEIDINVYFTPANYNANDIVFNNSFKIYKRFPDELFSFCINSSSDNASDMHIHSISSINKNYEISLECYDESANGTDTIKKVYFSNNGKFTESDVISDQYDYFKVTGLHSTNGINNITQYNNYITFNRNVMDASPETNFINQNISEISNYVPPYTFYNSNLSGITLDNSVTFIGDYGFYNDTNLTSISFPSAVTYIGQNAFSYCENILSMKFKAKSSEDNPPTLFENSFGSSPSDYAGNAIDDDNISVYTDATLSAFKTTVKRLIRYWNASYVKVVLGKSNNFSILGDADDRPGYTYHLTRSDNFK